MPSIHISADVTISRTFIRNVFIRACDGGINHWADIVSYHLGPDTSLSETPEQFCAVVTRKNGDGTQYLVNATTILEGIQEIVGVVRDGSHGRQFAPIAEQRDLLIRFLVLDGNDAEHIDDVLADLVVQVGLFGTPLAR